MLHNIILDAFFKGSMVKILPKENKIIGYCRNNNGGVPDNLHNYFVKLSANAFSLSLRSSSFKNS